MTVLAMLRANPSPKSLAPVCEREIIFRVFQGPMAGCCGTSPRRIPRWPESTWRSNESAATPPSPLVLGDWRYALQ